MIPNATDFESAAKALAQMLSTEREAHNITRESYNDLAKFTATLFADDRDNLLANASITYFDAPNGKFLNLPEVVEQRDRARDAFAIAEAELARAEATIARVQWLREHWMAVGKTSATKLTSALVLGDALDGDDLAEAVVEP